MPQRPRRSQRRRRSRQPPPTSPQPPQPAGAQSTESTPPFTLICYECDLGAGIESEAAALAAGWTEILPAFDLPQANYCGLCPDCRRSEEKAGRMPAPSPPTG